jgi:hypothetical protein
MAITEVQRVEATNAASASTIAVACSSGTVGNYVRVLVRCDDPPVGITITDNAGGGSNGYVSLGGIQEAGTTQWLEEFYGTVDNSMTTITADYGGAITGRAIAAIEYSGTSGVDGADQETDTGNNPTPTLSITNTVQPAVMFCACNDVQGGTPAVGSGFTDDGVVWSGFSACRLQKKNITTVAAQTGNFGNASLNRNNATAVIFTESGGGGVFAPPPPRAFPRSILMH